MSLVTKPRGSNLPIQQWAQSYVTIQCTRRTRKVSTHPVDLRELVWLPRRLLRRSSSSMPTLRSFRTWLLNSPSTLGSMIMLWSWSMPTSSSDHPSHPQALQNKLGKVWFFQKTFCWLMLAWFFTFSNADIRFASEGLTRLQTTKRVKLFSAKKCATAAQGTMISRLDLCQNVAGFSAKVLRLPIAYVAWSSSYKTYFAC